MFGSALPVTALPSTANLTLAREPPLDMRPSGIRAGRCCETSVDPRAMPVQREGRAGPRWYDTPLIWRGGVAAVKTGARETGIDLERFRLRRFVEELRQTGELEVRTGTAELAEVAMALEGNAKAVLFERVGKEGAQLVGNVMGSRARLARAFGTAPDKLLAEVLRRLRATPQGAARGGGVRQLRHPRARGGGVGAGGLSGRARPRRGRRSLRRVPRLLRGREAEPGVPSHRGDASPRRALPDGDDRRQEPGPHRYGAAERAAHRSHGLARSGDGGARDPNRVRHAFERRDVQPAHRDAPAPAPP